MSNFVVKQSQVSKLEDGKLMTFVVLDVTDSSMGWRLTQKGGTETSDAIKLLEPFKQVIVKLKTSLELQGPYFLVRYLRVQVECDHFDGNDVLLTVVKSDKFQEFRCVTTEKGYSYDCMAQQELGKEWLDDRGRLNFRISFGKEVQEQVYKSKELSFARAASNSLSKEVACDEQEHVLRKAYEDGEGADITFIAEGKRIPVMKSLLVAQSEVFKKMFAGQWKDTISGEIEVNDVEYEPMYKLLESLYAGYARIEDTLEALKLFELARTYQIQNIIKQSESYIADNLTMETLLHAFCSGHLHDSKMITTSVLDFISVNKGLQVTKLPGFDKLTIEHMTFIIESQSK